MGSRIHSGHSLSYVEPTKSFKKSVTPLILLINHPEPSPWNFDKNISNFDIDEISHNLSWRHQRLHCDT